MTCNIELKKNNEFLTSEWSGGTTTEIAIYPKNALYSERNFVWRLSSAKVEVEESTFTSLPDINRIIMILDGELKLEHVGYHQCTLEPFQQDRFSGSWNTKSYGRVTDFNLMMSEECNGELEPIFIKEGEEKKFILRTDKKHLKNTQAIYCVFGEVKIHTSTNEILTLHEGEVVLLTISNSTQLDFTVYNDFSDVSRLVKANIMY